MWFKLDDNFAHHEKVLEAGNAAVGLWVRCGTYSAGHLTDGRVPAKIAAALGTPRERKTLVSVRLWVPNGDGYLIPDFLDYNLSKAQVEANRAADRERQARRRRGENGCYE